MKIKAVNISLIFTVLFTLSFFHLLANDSPKAIIRLIDQIAVEAPDITLGEIAHIECDDEELRLQLLHLKVGETPNIGRSRIVSSYKVESVLEKMALTPVSIYGLQSTVRLETEDMNRMALQKNVEEWAKKCHEGKGRVEVKFIRLPTNFTVPKSDFLKLDIQSISKKSPLGKTNLVVKAFVGGKIFSTAHMRVKIQLYKTVPVAMRPLKSGEALREEHIKFIEKDIGEANGMEVLDPASLIGQLAKKDIAVGQMLSVKDFTHPVLIERGSKNIILIENGGVQMQVSGAEALENGKKDELIRFSNPLNPEQDLQARVFKRGIALIKLQ